MSHPHDPTGLHEPGVPGDLPGGGMWPLEGGWSGETFAAEVAGERSVVRIYGPRSAWRGPGAAEVDAAVLRLVRGLLPVPTVLEARRGDLGTDRPALLVTTLLPGVALDRLLPSLEPERLAAVARGVGAAAARLAQMPTPRAGEFRDASLQVESMPPEVESLARWVDHRERDLRAVGWTNAAFAALRDLADDADDILDGAPPRSCLVHSDLNPKNLLVDPGTLALTGVVDWEFAHSGSRFTDVGNLLRFERHPAWVEAVTGVWLERVPDAPAATAALLDLARAADLFALVDLAARRGDNPVAERAHHRLLSMASSRDLHASA